MVSLGCPSNKRIKNYSLYYGSGEAYMLYELRSRKARCDMLGKVKWFNNEKGYGFIEYEELEDIFVHYSAIVKDGYKTLKEGSLVNFKLIETSKGLQAVDVCEKELTTI